MELKGNLLMLVLKAVQLNSYLFFLFIWLSPAMCNDGLWLSMCSYLHPFYPPVGCGEVVHLYLPSELVVFCFVFQLTPSFHSSPSTFIFPQCDFLIPLCTSLSLLSSKCFCALLPLVCVCMHKRENCIVRAGMEHVSHPVLSFYRFGNWDPRIQVAYPNSHN